ncbi:MAG TPA: peptide deformylase [Bacilli bacterium]|nr:peptide deformylase [Bacilli bacterium]HOR20915.1 peptide deformylase [Bacilli bacterium]
MFKIVKDSSLSLRSKSKPVEMPLTKKDRDLILRMFSYLKKTQDPAFREKHPSIREGVGLAAPQVGVNKRMTTIYYHDSEGKEIQYALVNPRIIENSIKKCYLLAGEGCLSVDEKHEGYVPRDNKIKVRAYDVLTEADIEISARGYDAIVLQHEIDHLDGILYYDRINKNNPFQVIEGAVEIS